MDAWERFNGIFDRCAKLPHLPACFASFGLLQLWGCYVLNALANPVRTEVNAFPILQASLAYQNAYFVAQVLAFFLIGLLARRLSPYYRRMGLLVGCVAVMYGFTCLLFYAMSHMVPAWVLGAASILTGLAYAYLFMLHVELLGCLNGTLMIIGYLMGSIVYFATSLASHYMGLPLQTAVFVALPLLIVALYHMSVRWIDPSCLPGPIEERLATPWQIILLVAVFSLAFDLSGGFILYSKTEVLVRLGRLVPIAIILYMAMFSQHLEFARFYQLVVVFMILGLAAALFFDRDAVLTQVASQSGAESFSLLVFVVVCSYAYRLRVSSTVFYGPVIAINLGLRIVYDNVTLAYPFIVDSAALTIPLLVAGIVVLTLILNKADFVDRIRPVPSERVTARAALEAYLASLALSPQERTIAEELMAGKGAARIAEDLFISPSTVRVHMSAIYKKAGVHSREEFELAAKATMGDAGTLE